MNMWTKRYILKYGMRNMTVNFFGLEIAAMSRQEFFVFIKDTLTSGNRTTIATINPEMLLAAKKDRTIRRVLSTMSVLIPDGIGITLMSFFTGQGICPRYPGVDFFIELCGLANETKETVLLLGGWGKDAETACKVLKKVFPNVNLKAIGEIEIRYENG